MSGGDGKQRVCVMMHGILGSKSNWNTPAKRLLKEIGPNGWSILQLDHRGHGKSPGGEPPHSIEACAADVVDTMRAAGVDITGTSELVICGHSFGGKIALGVLRALLQQGTKPRMTWLFDSVPGCPVELSEKDARREQSVGFVLGAVEAASRQHYADREALITSLQDDHGLVKPLAQWVAQNVQSKPGVGIALSYDVETVRALYDAYRATDMWDLLESGQADIGVVVAGRNKHSWGEHNLDRLTRSQDQGVRMVVLESAGHNVHVDDLPGLLETLKPSFT